eukprot:scaffold83493_cov22-Tisochrysis_lutea.AAC.1
MQLDFSDQHRRWHGCPPADLYSVPVHRKVPEHWMSLTSVRALLWLDCVLLRLRCDFLCGLNVALMWLPVAGMSLPEEDKMFFLWGLRVALCVALCGWNVAFCVALVRLPVRLPVWLPIWIFEDEMCFSVVQMWLPGL